jgi:hypothetical protein
MTTATVEDHYMVRPDAFGRFEVYVRHGGTSVMRPRGRFSTVEAAQAWVDRRKARDAGEPVETPLQALRGKGATVNNPRRD